MKTLSLYTSLFIVCLVCFFLFLRSLNSETNGESIQISLLESGVEEVSVESTQSEIIKTNREKLQNNRIPVQPQEVEPQEADSTLVEALDQANARIKELEEQNNNLLAQIKSLEFQRDEYQTESGKTAVQQFLKLIKEEFIDYDDNQLATILSFIRRLGTCPTMIQVRELENAIGEYFPKIFEVRKRLDELTAPHNPVITDENDPRLQSILRELGDINLAWNEEVDRIFGSDLAKKIYMYPPPGLKR